MSFDLTLLLLLGKPVPLPQHKAVHVHQAPAVQGDAVIAAWCIAHGQEPPRYAVKPTPRSRPASIRLRFLRPAPTHRQAAQVPETHPARRLRRRLNRLKGHP